MVGLSDFIIIFFHVVKNLEYKWYYDINNDDVIDFNDVRLIWNEI
jgi:hypothetical protein